MIKPTDAEIFEDSLATYWLDMDGILNFDVKSTPRTLESSKSLIQSLTKMLGAKKVYCITDLTSAGEIPEESRAYYQKEVPALFKAVAYITQGELSRMVATVYSLIFNPSIPTKIFNNESDARAWLKALQEKGVPIIPENIEKKVKGKLLLVDDDPSEEKIIKYALEEGHWNVSIKYFQQPKKALDYLRETKDEIFLIISDINMPGMNGFDFKKAIDADTELARKSIPFIFSSNSAKKEDIVQAYDNRVQGYFQKPADLTEATELLDKIFDYWLVSRHPHKESYW
jgi:CheY-like chemotaxis protein